MAASSSSSSTRFHWKHDVFISFRGEDTREHFVSHLYTALCRKGIDTYVDVKLERGNGISPALLTAIEESRIAIVIFSENYASSSWCLDELVQILECHLKNGQVIIPVFYHVNPSHVRRQKGSYASAFAAHEKRFKDTILDQWRAALTTTANISGWDSSDPIARPESTLIKKVVDSVLMHLNFLTPREELSGLVGIDKSIEQIKTLLRIGSPDIRTVGIWGTGGMGKTTLAEVLYNQIYSEFESCCFLKHVRDEVKSRGLNYIEEKLFGTLLEEENNPNIVIPFLMYRLRRKRVLVVLDDVDDHRHLGHLLGNHDRFGIGSRIIITSRNRHLLKDIADGIFEVKPLDPNESCQLIVKNAFREYSPMMDPEYIWLLQRLVKHVGGIPLACEVMGYHLRGRSIAEWESALNKLEQIPDKQIEEVLRISYDALDDMEKHIFLDIACFFKGGNRDQVKKLMEDSFPDIGIENLIWRSLITIENNNLWMHELMQTMGWNIVRQESKWPGERSRLWNAQDIYQVLKNNTGTKAIEGIFLDVCETLDMSLAPSVFQNMRNLRLLKISNSDDIRNCKISFPQGLQGLPDSLRYLHWDAYPLHCMPSNFTGENLVELQITHSQIQYLPNNVNLSNLSTLNLSLCENLTQVPDLSKASKLETVNLQGCTSLLQVPLGIQHLEKLKSLNVEFCPLIIELPELPKSLESLKLSGIAIEELPSIGLLCSLKELHVKNCEGLISLPDNIHKLTSLQYLDLLNCSKLEKLPEILEPMNLLTDLWLSKTAIKVIPASWIENLVGLKFLNLDMCKNLELIPNNTQNMTSLQGISLRGCSKLKAFEKIPLSLRYFDAHGCISLENVSSSRTKLRKDRDEYQLGGRFVFYGCLKLSQSILIHIIMAELQLKILRRATTFSEIRQDRAVLPSFSVCLPGNQIPKKIFEYQSKGSSINIKPRLASWSNPNFLGFFLCAVVDSKDSSGFDGDLNLVCRLHCVTDNNDSLSWESMSVWGDRWPSLGCGRWGLCHDFKWGFESDGGDDQIANSSHMFFWDDYSHWTLVNNTKDKNEINSPGTSHNATQASFEFICLDKNSKQLKGQNVEKCGVHFLYRQVPSYWQVPSRL